jgi:hypothetical protein
MGALHRPFYQAVSAYAVLPGPDKITVSSTAQKHPIQFEVLETSKNSSWELIEDIQTTLLERLDGAGGSKRVALTNNGRGHQGRTK